MREYLDNNNSFGNSTLMIIYIKRITVPEKLRIHLVEIPV